MKVVERDPDSDLLEGYWQEFSWKAEFPVAIPKVRPFIGATTMTLSPEWHFLGVTPLYDVSVPRGMSVYRFELEGHEPVVRLSGGSVEVPVTA